MLTDRDKISNPYRGPPIDASYQVWFIWLSGFRGEDFLEINQSKTRIVCGGHLCLWQSCLFTDRDEMSNLYRGPSTDASHQVSVHLAEGFHRRRLKCEKLTDDGRQMPSDGKSLHCLWQNELKISVELI